MAVLGTVPGVASASMAPPHRLRPGVFAAVGSKVSLALAPAGLQAVVRRTLGAPAARAGSAVQQAKLTASDGASGDNFGVSVAISGSTAVVGASFKNSQTGAAYVFVRSGTAWHQQAKLTASDGASRDFFGGSVTLLASTAVVGAPGNNSGTGAAYVYVNV
jgi:FG-GAP repeat